MRQGCDVCSSCGEFFGCVLFGPQKGQCFGNWTWLDNVNMSRAGYSVWLEITCDGPMTLATE